MACKCKDGLFLGDYEAAQDLEFILANKITHIICCAGREVANCWERSGVKYLTYYWPENGNCIVFDEANAVLDEIYVFIEEAIEKGESVLVHSTDGVSRACFCCAVYFMLKYRWCVSRGGLPAACLHALRLPSSPTHPPLTLSLSARQGAVKDAGLPSDQAR